ncbi:hypothetical protein EW145_g1715 [Phellinidium pouzarii]|uniref:Major facilitator superfamily (MFS) profile domain-containing protein n=1 Tax=Phellinidium pouzarii TaxID=167371 RepID=A0A4S4LDF1_9AGAM|nr:hypothetical protein EW145_g1715 [Phellinidium pouzarii]
MTETASVLQMAASSLSLSSASFKLPIEDDITDSTSVATVVFTDVTPSPTVNSLHSICTSRTASVVNTPFKAEAEENRLPFLRLLFAHIGAALALFLATTDATIVSTSLPTIIADLHASQSMYPWVGVAYAVSQTALQPLYGRLSDLLGRKVVLYTRPLLGGAFSDSSGMLSWRWAFFINLPLGAIASLLLLFSLRNVPFRPASGLTWKDLWLKFDFFGLVFFMCGTIGVVLGFSFSSQYGCVILVISFLHNFAFNAGTFFLALYYQAVNGSNALEAGMRMLPYSLGSSIASIPAAWFIAHRQRKTKTTAGQKLVISLGLAIAILGFAPAVVHTGLLTILNERSSIALQEIAPLFAGIGIGMLFHSPYQVLTKALRPEDIASATGAFFLVRFTGATCGLAVAGAVFNGRLSNSIYPSVLGSASSTIDLRGLSKLQPLLLRQEVLHAVSSAIQSIWIVCAPCLGIALLISPLIKTVSTDSASQELTLPPCSADEKSSQV